MPLIVRVPPKLRASTVTSSIASVVRTADIYPTVLDYLGLKSPKPTSGKSLRPLIEGKHEPDRIAYADQINGYDLNAGLVRSRPLDDFLYCAMDAHWKLVYRPAHPEASELFDLRADPHESVNASRAPGTRARW